MAAGEAQLVQRLFCKRSGDSVPTDFASPMAACAASSCAQSAAMDSSFWAAAAAIAPRRASTCRSLSAMPPLLPEQDPQLGVRSAQA
ncbi:hypothetical protein DIPPA_18135 [Diplonema papillatum]|nr:hypothetical protein DIPPA_18135 [Diplonema papillatum]